MQMRDQVIQGVEAILAEYGSAGQLEIFDVSRVLMLACYDDQGHINQEGLQALVYVYGQYRERMSGLFSVLFEEALNSIPGNPALYVPDGGKPTPPEPQRPKDKPSSQPARTKPKPAPVRPANLNPMLVGVWEYSTYTSVDGFSHSTSRVRAFGADGRFVESSSSYINAIQRDSCGDETSRTYADNVSPEDRGTWSTDGDTLRLVWDDHQYAVFDCNLGPEGMLLTPIDPPGKEKYWARIG